MSTEESWPPGPTAAAGQNAGNHRPQRPAASIFDETTGIYRSVHETLAAASGPNPNPLDAAAFVLSQFPPPHRAESRVALVDASTGRRATYAELRRSVLSLAAGLRDALGVQKGDVVFVLSPNSLLYPAICLAVLSVGAVLTTANPLNTAQEIAKQLADSAAKLAISDPAELNKVVPTGVPTILTHREPNSDHLSVEELIESCEPVERPDLEMNRPSPSDAAAILYSSGTTGTSKGVVLTHASVVAVVRLLRWSVGATRSRNDVFLCFVPMFHVYGLVFFGLGLLCCGTATVVMRRFELGAMLAAVEAYGVKNIPAVPPVILGMVKLAARGSGAAAALAGVRRVGSGAAPLSKEVVDEFRLRFPWIELRPGYGLTESSGATTLFISDKDAKARPASCGGLLPGFCAKIVDVETGKPLPPYKDGELWIKSPTVMKEYLGKRDATAETIVEDGWLRTGDLCCFDEEGFLYVVDRIKELIKHNGFQVAPAELEAILLGHPDILDAAVIPVEDEEAGEIPMAYVVRASGADLSQAQVIEYVARQVAPYKKIRRVAFIDAIPRSSAGKILRKDLILQNKQQTASKL